MAGGLASRRHQLRKIPGLVRGVAATHRVRARIEAPDDAPPPVPDADTAKACPGYAGTALPDMRSPTCSTPWRPRASASTAMANRFTAKPAKGPER